MTDQWATYAEAARLCRLRPDLLRQWASRGRITKRVIGGRVYVLLAEVRRAEKDLRETGPNGGRGRARVAC